MEALEFAECQEESTGWFNWTKSSAAMLRAVEKTILSHLKIAYRGFFINIGPCVGEQDKVWTVTLNTESKNTPIVMLHGLCAGVALWVLNLDSIAGERPVYAIDLLGFGRSSRPDFDSDPMIAEKQMVKALEEWRKEMNLNEMIVLGHSFGGFLGCSYALSYPERVKHLILADPWGFPVKPEENLDRPKLPLWARAIVATVKPFNVLATVRFAGPWGEKLIEKTRPDIMRKFSAVLMDPSVIPKYIHQCNAQRPTGESAFHHIMRDFGWAKNPMIDRIGELKSTIPITFLYGGQSWVDNAAGRTIQALRGQSYVKVQIIEHAGHHIYADDAEVFNQYVNAACALCDVKQDVVAESENDAIQTEGI